MGEGGGDRPGFAGDEEGRGGGGGGLGRQTPVDCTHVLLAVGGGGEGNAADCAEDGSRVGLVPHQVLLQKLVFREGALTVRAGVHSLRHAPLRPPHLPVLPAVTLVGTKVIQLERLATFRALQTLGVFPLIHD